MRRTAFLALLCAARIGAQSETTDPNAAHIIMSDVPRFWAAFDSRGAVNATTALESLYLRPATPGLRDFSRMRIGGASALAAAITRDSTLYLGIRAATLSVASESTAVRAAFRRMHDLYPDAVFPDVYFVIGRRSAAGTVSNAGILIGLEQLASGENASSLINTPAIVAHELVHYQQRVVGRTLLAAAVREGGADFLAELATGMELNHPLHEWFRQHERDAWAAFERAMLAPVDERWFNTPPQPGWPTDLAYAVGYRIARCYYDESNDKAAAVRQTMVIPDAVSYLHSTRCRIGG